MAIKEVLHTDLAPAAVGPYSQAIASNGFIYTSGQIPIDPATGKIEAATIEEQTEPGHEEPSVRSGTGRRILRPRCQDHLFPV